MSLANSFLNDLGMNPKDFGIIADDLECVPVGEEVCLPTITVDRLATLYYNMFKDGTKPENTVAYWKFQSDLLEEEERIFRCAVMDVIEKAPRVIQAKRKGGNTVLFHPSLKSSKALYQLTVFDRRGPVYDTQVDSVDEIVDELEECERVIYVD